MLYKLLKQTSLGMSYMGFAKLLESVSGLGIGKEQNPSRIRGRSELQVDWSSN